MEVPGMADACGLCTEGGKSAGRPFCIKSLSCLGTGVSRQKRVLIRGRRPGTEVKACARDAVMDSTGSRSPWPWPWPWAGQCSNRQRESDAEDLRTATLGGRGASRRDSVLGVWWRPEAENKRFWKPCCRW